jgi:hypothetical protein
MNQATMHVTVTTSEDLEIRVDGPRCGNCYYLRCGNLCEAFGEDLLLDYDCNVLRCDECVSGAW